MRFTALAALLGSTVGLLVWVSAWSHVMDNASEIPGFFTWLLWICPPALPCLMALDSPYPVEMSALIQMGTVVVLANGIYYGVVGFLCHLVASMIKGWRGRPETAALRSTDRSSEVHRDT